MIAALTVRQAAERLGRSRRQLYRHIHEGRIAPVGKLLGEWLLREDDIETLARYPLRVQRLPAHLAELFPEYDVSELNAGRDQVLVIARVLEHGGQKALRWLLRRYRPDELLRFMRADSARLLSPRSLRFWSLYFEATPDPLPEWRRDPWKTIQ